MLVYMHIGKIYYSLISRFNVNVVHYTTYLVQNGKTLCLQLIMAK